MTTTRPRFTLVANGIRYEIESEESGISVIARLFIDGQPVAERKGSTSPLRLEYGDLIVAVHFNWLNYLTECIASFPDPGNGKRVEYVFTAPQGSVAAKQQQFAQERPGLYATRHLVFAIGSVLVGLLGINLLIAKFLPDVSLPDWDIPFPDPGWIRDIPEITDLPFLRNLELARFGQWIGDLPKWWIPIVVAVFIGLGEYDRRNKQRRSEVDSEKDLSGPPNPSNEPEA